MRMPKPLTGSVLSRLAAEALATYLGQAEAFEVAMHPGCCLVRSGEPVADVNYLVARRAAAEGDHLAAACISGISGGLPFLPSSLRRPVTSVKRTAATSVSSTSGSSVHGARRRRDRARGKRTPSSWGARTGPAMRKPT